MAPGPAADTAGIRARPPPRGWLAVRIAVVSIPSRTRLASGVPRGLPPFRPEALGRWRPRSPRGSGRFLQPGSGRGGGRPRARLPLQRNRTLSVLLPSPLPMLRLRRAAGGGRRRSGVRRLCRRRRRNFNRLLRPVPRRLTQRTLVDAARDREVEFLLRVGVLSLASTASPTLPVLAVIPRKAALPALLRV